MDSYIQILCRFQKSKRKVPPPSPPFTKKSPKEDFSHPLEEEGELLVIKSDGGGTFHLNFWNLHKIWM